MSVTELVSFIMKVKKKYLILKIYIHVLQWYFQSLFIREFNIFLHLKNETRYVADISKVSL